ARRCHRARVRRQRRDARPLPPGLQRLVRVPLPLHAVDAREAAGAREEAGLPRGRLGTRLPRGDAGRVQPERAVRRARRDRNARHGARRARDRARPRVAALGRGLARARDAAPGHAGRGRRERGGAGALPLGRLRGGTHAPDLGAAGMSTGTGSPAPASAPAAPAPPLEDRFRAFLVLWGSQTLSLFGTMVSQFAVNVWLRRDPYP